VILLFKFFHCTQLKAASFPSDRCFGVHEIEEVQTPGVQFLGTELTQLSRLKMMKQLKISNFSGIQ
jgi:hypothetical protein